MVSPQRVMDKISRLESKVLAYRRMLKTGRFPESRDIINFHESRTGEQTDELEQARAVQAIHDLKRDILKNLEAIELTQDDYLAQLVARGAEGLLAEFGPDKKTQEDKEDA